jgi:CBS domain containing-hemolysin-like protein
VLSAFFSGMEIAYVSSNRIHIELEKKQKGLLARLLSRLTASPSRFIASMLIGNNLALVIYGYYMGKLLLEVLPVVTPESNAIAALVFGEFQLLTHTLISTLFILLTAEFLPKAIFQIYANTLMKALALPAYIFYNLFSGYRLNELLGTESDERLLFGVFFVVSIGMFFFRRKYSKKLEKIENYL